MYVCTNFFVLSKIFQLLLSKKLNTLIICAKCISRIFLSIKIAPSCQGDPQRMHIPRQLQSFYLFCFDNLCAQQQLNNFIYVQMLIFKRLHWSYTMFGPEPPNLPDCVSFREKTHKKLLLVPGKHFLHSQCRPLGWPAHQLSSEDTVKSHLQPRKKKIKSEAIVIK